MSITINGLSHSAVKAEQSLHEVIVQLGFDPSVVVAELNRSIVPGEAFQSTILHDGDSLELLSFVGGG